jgi:hypothetical protein
MREAARKLWFAGPLVLLAGAAAALGLRWVAREGPPELVLAPADLDFGRVAIGASEESALVATNTGARRLRLEVAPVGAPFRLAARSLELEPGESRALSVAFGPSERGPVDATLRVTSGGREHPVALRGTGYRPAEIHVSPLSLSFGEVALGSASRGLVTILNRGDEVLQLAAYGARNFRPGAQSAVVEPEGTLTLDVTFAPNRAGRVEEVLWIRSNDPARGQIGLHLRGSGAAVPPRAALEASVGALDFGAVPACETRERWLEITNRGADRLTIASVTAIPPFWAPERGFRLEPGHFLRLPVVFAPTEPGPLLSPLLIHSNDPDSGLAVVSLLGDAHPGDCTRSASEARTGLETQSRGAGLRLGGGLGPTLPPAEQGIRTPVDSDPPSPAEEPGAVAVAPPPVREGSFVDLGTYRADIGPEHVASVRLDPASGQLALDGVHLPVVELPFEQFFDFEPTGAAGSVGPLGDVDLVLPVEIFDEEGYATRLEVALTTGTAANLRPDGTLVTLAGEPLGAEGDATLVGLAKLPSGGLAGSMMEIVLNVHVEP